MLTTLKPMEFIEQADSNSFVLHSLSFVILGNMWAQSWGNIYDILEPYPGQGRESLTTEMERQVSV